MLGETIAKLRKSKGLTQAQMAKQIHVTQGAVSQWETGRTAPDVQQMFILAEFFGVTVDSLQGGVAETEADRSAAKKRTEILQKLESLPEDKLEDVLRYAEFVAQRK